MKPFRVDVAQTVLDDLNRRLDATRWPAELPDASWDRGVPLEYLRELTDYWRTEYDWRAAEARLNAVPQFTTAIDGARVHFLHVRSPEPHAVPLLITHGWPGSIVEFLGVVGPLTDPRAHGGDPADAFHLVLPSIPGFGFSGPTRDLGWGVGRIAGAWAELMHRLGYQRYLVQGGDIGAWISLVLAGLDAERVAGAHVNFLAPSPDDGSGDYSEDDRDRLRLLERFLADGAGYMVLQATRPYTVSYALTDSPVGQLAWIVEKFREWSDSDKRPEDAVDRDDLLTNVMLYWLTGTAATSAQFYYEMADFLATAPPREPPAEQPPLPVPLGVAVYAADLLKPLRRQADRAFSAIVQWREHDRGGHFAALEEPDLFVDDLRRFRRTLPG